MLCFADRDRHELSCLGIAARQPPHALQDLVAALQAARGDELLEATQAPRQPMALTTANRSLLLSSRATSRQQVVFALAANQLDLDLRVFREPLPGAAFQLALERGQFTAPGRQHIPSPGLLEERQR